jgi:Carbamoyl-phosphate synthase L chain, ATP binding domain
MSDHVSQQTHRNAVVLLISTSPSFSPARLAMALAKYGFIPNAVCPSRHTLRKTHAVARVFSYSSLAPWRSIKAAILAGKPALLIPCDDWAASLLHDLHSDEMRKGGPATPIPRLIEESLGSPLAFPIAYERTALLKLAQEEGLRVPKIEALTSIADLAKWAREVGFPAVLKTDSTSGGEGVRIVNSLAEAERAFKDLRRPPRLARALKRTWLDQDMALLWPALKRTHRKVNIQAFVAGQDATTAIACWKGNVLASLHFEVLSKQDASGPSTALRLIENQEMSATAKKLAQRLGLSGLHGFDFILERGTDRAHLIEMNPRATQVGHLPLGQGRDLPAALSSAITGEPLRPNPPVTEKDTIALFPQEWLKNPSSHYLREAYHDVPWEEPEFVLACLERRRKQKAWYSIQRWTSVFSRSLQVK